MDYVIRVKPDNLAFTGISRGRAFSFGTQNIYLFVKSNYFSQITKKMNKRKCTIGNKNASRNVGVDVRRARVTKAQREAEARGDFATQRGNAQAVGTCRTLHRTEALAGLLEARAPAWA